MVISDGISVQRPFVEEPVIVIAITKQGITPQNITTTCLNTLAFNAIFTIYYYLQHVDGSYLNKTKHKFTMIK